MQKILISRCLLGDRVRYDGRHCQLTHPLLQRWQQENRLVPICPEMEGGLSTPRPPAEILPNARPIKVITTDGADLTPAFTKGAQLALSYCRQQNIGFALLKSRSPSCAIHQIYDGSFTGQLIHNPGITAALLIQHGVRCFDETELEKLALALRESAPTN